MMRNILLHTFIIGAIISANSRLEESSSSSIIDSFMVTDVTKTKLLAKRMTEAPQV